MDTFLYREVSTFLDIRRFMEKPRNVNTLLYREVSTFVLWKTLNMWIPDYIGRDPHILSIMHYMRNPKNLDSCLYREGSTFSSFKAFYGKP